VDKLTTRVLALAKNVSWDVAKA